MDDVISVLDELRSAGWTIAAISDALGVSRRAVERWQVNERSPANVGPVLASLRQLERRKVPPRRRVKRSEGG